MVYDRYNMITQISIHRGLLANVHITGGHHPFLLAMALTAAENVDGQVDPAIVHDA